MVIYSPDATALGVPFANPYVREIASAAATWPQKLVECRLLLSRLWRPGHVLRRLIHVDKC